MSFASTSHSLQGASTPPGCSISPNVSGNNGDLLGYTYTDNVNSSMSHSALYVYDTVNRLNCAQATGNSTYNLDFSYDAFGNMTCVTNQYTSGPCPGLSYTGLNRISGYSYDASGDVTNDGSHAYQYDAEGHVTAVDSGNTETYAYNAQGQEVYLNAPDWYTWDHLYDSSGAWIGRWGGGSWQVPGFFHLSGRPFAAYIDQAYSIHVNSIGTTAMDANAAGSIVGDMAVYPWGQFWIGSSPEWHYAAFEYGDSATGFYPTPTRQYSNTPGRWMTPDTVRGDVNNPQSLNLYSYVTNNPTTLTDPSGKCGCGGGGSALIAGGGGGGGGGCGGGGGFPGGGGGGSGGRGTPPPPPTIPIPGPETTSIAGGGLFSDPFSSTQDQQTVPWFSVIVSLPLPPWPPIPPGGGSSGNSGGNAGSSNAVNPGAANPLGYKLCHAGCKALLVRCLAICGANEELTPLGVVACAATCVGFYEACDYECRKMNNIPGGPPTVP